MSSATAPARARTRIRCSWPSSPISIAYHDREWGVPLKDDRKLFEFLVLDAAQAGLSWEIILRKREGFRAAFDDFNAEKIARYNDKKIKELLADPGIIRNRLKIDSTITNAQAFLKIQKEFGSFDKYIWQFVEGKPLQSNLTPDHKMIASTKLSDTISKDLKNRGFRFVGTTIIYAFMQATGLVNDHTSDCYRFAALSKPSK